MAKTFSFKQLLTAALFVTLLFSVFARAGNSPAKADESPIIIEKTQNILNDIIEKSFPDLKTVKIKVKTLKNQNDYFKARFSFSRFLTFQKTRTIVFVNPLVFERNAPEEGVRAILAHELAHALYYQARNRLKLFGLVGLISGEFTAKFERRADLVAVFRGYGAGLIKYRNWLYQNISPAILKSKERNYFTPDELKILIPAVEGNLQVFEKLEKNVPLNLTELEKAVK